MRVALTFEEYRIANQYPSFTLGKLWEMAGLMVDGGFIVSGLFRRSSRLSVVAIFGNQSHQSTDNRVSEFNGTSRLVVDPIGNSVAPVELLSLLFLRIGNMSRLYRRHMKGSTFVLVHSR